MRHVKFHRPIQLLLILKVSFIWEVCESINRFGSFFGMFFSKVKMFLISSFMELRNGCHTRFSNPTKAMGRAFLRNSQPPPPPVPLFLKQRNKPSQPWNHEVVRNYYRIVKKHDFSQNFAYPALPNLRRRTHVWGTESDLCENRNYRGITYCPLRQRC